ncbi:MAG: C40 family peptidase [Candidatus Krumholzibacteriota bacterium]
MAGIKLKSIPVLGIFASVLAGVLLTGCTPKRVLRRDPAPVPVPEAEPASAPVQEEYASERPPGEPDLSLPEPEFRGATGTSSLETSSANPPGTPAAQPPSGSSLGLAAAALAEKQLGKPYQWGASGPEKFDCSGLVMYVFDNLGVKLPRVSGQQAYAGVHVDREDLQRGDLVFFKLTGSRIDHVGIYVGHSKFIHAPRKHVPVSTESLNNSYWRRRFKGGRRLK